jgi:hypothetical protein
MFSGYFLISCILYLSGKPRYSRPIVTRDISILEGNSLFGLLPRRYRFSWRDVGYIQGTRQVFSLMFVLGMNSQNSFSWLFPVRWTSSFAHPMFGAAPAFAHSILGVAPAHSSLFIYWFDTSPFSNGVIITGGPCPDFSLISGIPTTWRIPPVLLILEYGLNEVFLLTFSFPFGIRTIWCIPPCMLPLSHPLGAIHSYPWKCLGGSCPDCLASLRLRSGLTWTDAWDHVNLCVNKCWLTWSYMVGLLRFDIFLVNLASTLLIYMS